MSASPIVVSYARRDAQAAAEAVAALLAGHQLDCALDHECLEGGEPWEAQFRRLIQGAAHLVLMLSPAALASGACRWEWECARQAGLQISPVRAGEDIDTASLPAWMRAAHRYNLDIEGQRRNFLRVVEGPANRWQVPFMVPFANADFVDRPRPLEAAKATLLEGRSVAITAALRGPGGFGKTSLAVQLAEDRQVRDAFYDGVLWVTFGEEVSDPVPKLADLVEKLLGTRPGFTTPEAAREAFVTALADRRCLLVLDDVWRRADIAPFLPGRENDRTARLITTRDRAVLPRGAEAVIVEEMRPEEALRLLTRGLPEDPATRPALAALAAERFGGWALLLTLGNSLLRGRVEKGQSLPDAVAFLEEALARRGFAGALARGDAEGYRRGVENTVALSLETLPAGMVARAEELGAVAEDAAMTLASAARLWGLDEFEAEEIADTLHDRSLISGLDLGARRFRLHDTLRQVLGERAGAERLRAAHARLAAGWRAELGGHWEGLRDAYALDWLPAHLKAAGDAAGLDALLLDPGWMMAKLRGPGVQALLADYRTQAPDRGSPLGMVGQVLALAAGPLGEAPEELPGQVLGRLADADGPAIAGLRAKALRLAPRGRLIAAWRSLTGPGAELMRLVGHSGPVSSVAFSPDGTRLASGSEDNTLRLWDAASGACLATLEGHSGEVMSVAFSPDGTRLASGSGDYTLRLWDATSGACIGTLEGHTRLVASVAFSPDGTRIASASRDSTLRLWDTASGACLATLEGHSQSVESVAFSPDGTRLASGSEDNTLRLWDAASGACLATLEGHTGFVTSVAFSPNGTRLASGSCDNTLRLWDVASGACLATLEGHIVSVASVAFSPDEARLASGSYDHTLRLWDAASGACLATLEGHTGSVSSVALSPDGTRLASGSRDKTLRLWDAASGACLATLEGHSWWVDSVAFSPDSTRIASGSGDGTLRLWDTASGACLATLEGHSKSVESVAFSPDGTRLASGSGDGTLRLWDAASGAYLDTLEGHTSEVHSVAFSPDGTRLASASRDGTLRLWDVASGACRATLEGHSEAVRSVAFSPDSTRLASGSNDKTLRLWDAASGACLATLEGISEGVSSVAFSPDGTRLASGCWDNTLWLWDAASGRPISRLTLDGPVTAVAMGSEGRLVAGDSLGRLHRFTIRD